MRWLYSLLFYAGLPFVWLRLLWRARRNPDYGKRWSERLGYVPHDIPPGCIWWHCVSVGETLAALPLIKSLQLRHPGVPVLVTTMTPTGSVQVKKQLGESVFHMYAPYDLPHVWSRFLKRISPKLLIIMETEIWPNMLAGCHQRHIPSILINARLSQKSAKGYGYFGKSIADILNYLDTIAVQNKKDAERFIRLGVLPEKLHITGSVKFDIQLPEDLIEKSRELREKWGLSRPVFIAASTHAGEEEIILDAFGEILIQKPNALLILVPRHPDRIKQVIKLCYSYKLRSKGELPDANTKIFLIDTLGELLLFYAVADVAFVGGSLVPRGGHNVLEPASLSLPIITGPSLYNFAQIEKLLLQADGLVKVNNASELADTVLKLFSDKAMGARARAVIEANRGASEKQLALIEGLLK